MEHLKKIEQVSPPKTPAPDKYESLERELLSLIDFMPECGGTVKFDYKGSTLAIHGIPEDYRVLLNGQQVCECVYDNVYNLNKGLADKLL